MIYQTLQMFRPAISARVTQGWGENRACIDSRSGVVYGVTNQCRAGDQSVYQTYNMNGHNGIDIGGLRGADIYHAATFDGWMKTERDNRGGIGVDVVSAQPLFFSGSIPEEIANTAQKHTQNGVIGFIHYVKIRYWHLQDSVGHDGKKVTCGTVIGLMGNTGISSGVHLHFAPKWCDKDGRGLAQSNGYAGAFDPRKYINMRVTAKDHSDLITKESIPLSTQEKKDIEAQLNSLQMLLLALQKLTHSL